jgi:Tfp pilus assembly protein PilF
MKRLLDRISGMFGTPGAAAAAGNPVVAQSSPALAIQSAIGLQQAGRLREAEAIYLDVLAADPDCFDALHLMGVVAQQMGDSARAVELMSEALAIEPANCQALCNIAVAYRALNRLDDAEESLRKALALKPDWDRAHNNLGTMYQARGDLDQAETCFRNAIASNPDNADALANLGSICKDRGDPDQAEAYYRRALKLKPGAAETCTNLGAVLQQRGDSGGAEDFYRRALALRPDYASAHNNLGSIFLMQRKLTEAEACLRTALQLNPNDASARYNLSMVALLRGDYREGLALYESRFDGLPHELAGARVVAGSLKAEARWQGDSLPGKRVLVWTEQGLGDSLMMMRYLPMLKERGAGAVTVLCDPALVRVMQSMPGVNEVACRIDAVSPESYDAHCPIMSLPHLFGTRRDSIPCSVPYLSVPAPLKSEWDERLSGITAMKVGLVWAGNSALRADSRRSIALDQFAPFQEIDGIQLISLQKGEAARQLEQWGGRIPNWMDACVDFMDTAALVDRLDLVISVDTAVAHLAGALGKPVWLLNRSESEWRWGLEGEGAPWYPTMKIFRQRRELEWESVIQRIANELAARISP